jgi:mannose-6-phosphate isomerase
MNEVAVTIEENSPKGQLLVCCKYFECYKYDISDVVSINVDTASFRSVIFTEGHGTIRVGEDVKSYKAGDSFYITAGNKTVKIEGTGVAIVTKV